MRSIVVILAALLVVAGVGLSRAENADSITVSHGLSIFGDLKYGPDFTHFDYVNPDAPKAGTLRQAAEGTFDNLNPFILKGVAEINAASLFESLLDASADEPDSAYGLIAESVEYPADRSWIAFTLRPEARWHDRSPITADDVVFSFETLTTKGHPRFRLLYADVETVERVGERKVRFSFNNLENRKLPLIVGAMPIISKAYYETHEFDRTTHEPPMGSGPFRVANVDPGRSIEYERYRDYWGWHLPVRVGRHNFDRVVIDYFRDRVIAVQALKSYEYDFHEEFTSKTWSTAYEGEAVKQGLLVKEVIADNTPSGVQAFYINTRRPKFADPRMRRALAYAFDFEWTNKILFYGLYERMDSFFENSDLAATGLPSADELELLTPYRGRIPEEVFTEVYKPPSTNGAGDVRRNLREARRLLEEAGWQMKDGKLVNPWTEEQLEIEFLYFLQAFERIIAPFIRNLEKLGIHARMRLVDVPQYQRRIEEFDFDITTRREIRDLSPGVELRQNFGSEAADIVGGFNVAGIKDPVVDELVEKVIAASDRRSLRAATRALDRVLLWSHYVIPQWFKAEHHLVYWDKFGWPAIRPKFSIGLDTWWIDVEKEAALIARRKELG